MSISENLKLAIKVSSVMAIGAGTVAFTATRPEPPQTPVESIEIDVESVSETATTFEVTKLSTTSTEESTTTSSTTTTTSIISTTTVATTTTEAVTEPVTEPVTETEELYTEFDLAEALEEEQPDYNSSAGSLIRGDMRGTYYAPGSWNNYSNIGGSGRYLLDCNYGGDGYAKGSIASGYLYNLIGYYSNGGRTAVWLEISGYPDMSGVYYLDDCSGADVIDFFYDQNYNCQFCYDGVVSVDVYYAN